MKPLQGDSVAHIQQVFQWIRESRSFALIRPNDGERAVLQRTEFSADAWQYHGEELISNDLWEALQQVTQMEGLYVGLPCSGCGWGFPLHQWYRTEFPFQDERITYVNLFVNYNYPAFLQWLNQSAPPFFYIGPGHPSAEIAPLVRDQFPIDLTLVQKWPVCRDRTLNALEEWVGAALSATTPDMPCPVFLVAAGPLAKIFVVHLFKRFPNAQFLDIGSALDPFFRQLLSRPYMSPDSHYSRIICHPDYLVPHG